jgi:hypothetical protein
MPQFSRLKIFGAIAAMSAGLASWRLPEGNWFDVLIYSLSFSYASSLVRKALA